MSFQVRQLNPASDDAFACVLEAAFARTNRESEMARILASHPNFAADLSLVIEQDGESLGAAVFMPQDLRMHGVAIKSAACAPLGVTPSARGRGVGAALLEEGLARLKQQGTRCTTAIGAPEFFAPAGFGAAFDLYTQQVPIPFLPQAANGAANWRGLTADDLTKLPALDRNTWKDVDGSVIRASTEFDWAARARDSHALCSEEDGELSAYLRFRIRETVEITDCCVSCPRDIEKVFALLAKLGKEHSRAAIELRLPPTHPVARAAFRLGCPVEAGNFGSASMLAVLDWQGLFEDLGSIFSPRLLRAPRPSLSLGIDGEDYRIAFVGGRFECNRERDAEQHVDLPSGWGPGLMTGKHSGSELAFEVEEGNPETVALLEALFPRRTPTWTYGPILEIADD